MAIVFMTDEVTGRCVLFSEPNSIGHPSDRNAPRNAPLVDPIGNIALVYFCSDFDYFQAAVAPTGVSVLHGGVATTSTVVPLGPYTYTLVGSRVEQDYLLVNHNLGYIPTYMIIYAGRLLVANTILRNTSGQARVVSPYVTTTQLRLFEVGLVNDVSMPAETFSYTVVVFKQPVASGSFKMDHDPATGRVQMGMGKFDSNLPMLRRAGVGGDTPFDIITSPYIDISNGRVRQTFPGGIFIDEPGYDGSFGTPTSFQGAIV
jgi:hypothetical protein